MKDPTAEFSMTYTRLDEPEAPKPGSPPRGPVPSPLQGALDQTEMTEVLTAWAAANAPPGYALYSSWVKVR